MAPTQPSLPFMPARPLSPRPNRPSNISPSKRGRAGTQSDYVPSTLPPARRTKPPPLKPVGAFMFTGVHPLYTRTVCEEDHKKMWITCSQPGCSFPRKLVDRSLVGTNNYQTHYRNIHPQIPVNKKEAQAAAREKLSARVLPFAQPAESQTHDERFRILLLEFIIKNNLSFSLVDQAQTKALFKHLSPDTKQISRFSLMKDLKDRYEAAEKEQYATFQQHIERGGRVALTTDAWSGNNKLDYAAVTGHIITKGEKSEHISLTLDIIELSDACHSGVYLATKLLEVTDRWKITQSVISITRDNASPNDSMMDEFEAAVEEQYDAMDEKDQAANFLKFSRIEGDVRCCAHIYNIAIQAGILFFHPFISIVTNFLQLSSQSNLRPKAHVNTTPMH